jgi:hypothetical protein
MEEYDYTFLLLGRDRASPIDSPPPSGDGTPPAGEEGAERPGAAGREETGVSGMEGAWLGSPWFVVRGWGATLREGDWTDGRTEATGERYNPKRAIAPAAAARAGLRRGAVFRCGRCASASPPHSPRIMMGVESVTVRFRLCPESIPTRVRVAYAAPFAPLAAEFMSAARRSMSAPHAGRARAPLAGTSSAPRPSRSLPAASGALLRGTENRRASTSIRNSNPSQGGSADCPRTALGYPCWPLLMRARLHGPTAAAA